VAGVATSSVPLTRMRSGNHLEDQLARFHSYNKNGLGRRDILGLTGLGVLTRSLVKFDPVQILARVIVALLVGVLAP
jgi:hypothetical protein